MLMTEAEARTKWCPMFRRAGGNGNADADGGRRSNCIASGCAMWRWAARLTETHTSYEQSEQGYCGVAGKTEFMP